MCGFFGRVMKPMKEVEFLQKFVGTPSMGGAPWRYNLWSFCRGGGGGAL